MPKKRTATPREKDTVEGGHDRTSLPRPTATAARRRRPTSKAIAPKARAAPPRKKLKGKKGKYTHALEAHSRKSTRGGANRIKPDSQQRRRATRAARSPERRHDTRGG